MDIKIRDFEVEIIKSLRSISTPFLDVLMQIITFLGEQYVLILALAIIYFIYDKKIGQTIAFTLFTSLLINNSIKGLVKYPRPFTYDSSIEAVRKETATGYSFPSGHTQNASTLYPSIVYNSKFNKKTKKILWIVVSILILLIGFSRVYLGVHYPKDVIFGMILGLTMTFICSLLFNKCKGDFKKELILFSITLIIFLPFLFVFYKSSYEEIKLFRDFYLAFALFLGFILAYVIDNRFVNYTCNTKLSKKLVRLLGAVICCLMIQVGLKQIFALISENNIFLDFIRYFLITFIVLGIYPLLFRKKLFKD